MLTIKEYIFMTTILVCSLTISFYIFYNILDIEVVIIFALAIVGMSKTGYDIINKTGDKDIYVYTDSANQKLRYLVFIVTSIVALGVMYNIYNEYERLKVNEFKEVISVSKKYGSQFYLRNNNKYL